LLFEHAGKVDATFDVGSVGAKALDSFGGQSNFCETNRASHQREPLRLDETTLIHG
jgi:hypothetical protein